MYVYECIYATHSMVFNVFRIRVFCFIASRYLAIGPEPLKLTYVGLACKQKEPRIAVCVCRWLDNRRGRRRLHQGAKYGVKEIKLNSPGDEEKI